MKTPPPLTHEQLPEPVAWLVCSVNADGSLSLEYSAPWREAAHEHINECVEVGIEGAEKWVVRPSHTADQMLEVAAQRDQAWREALENVEPYGQVTVVRREGCVDMHWFYRHPEPPYLDNAAECHAVYTTPQLDRVAELEAEVARLREVCAKGAEALKSARQFIVNGVEFGYIRMPDADTPDSAHDTLPEIDAALAQLQAEGKAS